jgi:hypothetical protein
MHVDSEHCTIDNEKKTRKKLAYYVRINARYDNPAISDSILDHATTLDEYPDGERV